jgi:pilus assembly protein CpaF
MSLIAERFALVEHLRRRLVAESRFGSDGVDAGDLAGAVEAMLDEERRVLPASERAAVVQSVVDETVGLGPLEPLLRDPGVSEVMVNGSSAVFVEREGRLHRTEARFADASHVMHVIDRILSPLGRRVDEASPMVDARLPDGSRVNAVIPPLALDGPILTIRRFAAEPLGVDDLVALGTLDAATLSLLGAAVRARRNVLVTGGTGTGKTTTLAALAALIPTAERVVTIEDAAELRVALPHVVRLESRPPSLEGRGAVPIRALVRNALRMRPDRILVGEVRGGEALDLLQALTTGHEGSLSTLHASSPADAMRRLVTMALMGDVDLPYRAVADQAASAVDLIVHQARLADGRRLVVEVAAGDGGPVARSLVCWRPGARRGATLAGRFEVTEAGASWAAAARHDGRMGGR